MGQAKNPTEAKLQLRAAVEAGEISLGQAARAMREITGMNQKDFAERVVGVSSRILSAIERDEANPKVETLNKIGRAFGYEVGWVRKSPNK